MTSDQIRYFLSVAETSSLSASAKLLNLSQSTLARQIMLFEKELQLDLFNRSRSAVELTESGKIMKQWFQSASVDFSDLSKEMHKISQRDSMNSLEVGILRGLNVQGLMDTLKIMRSKHSDYEISLRWFSQTQLVAGLDSGKLDLIIGFSPDALRQNELSSLTLAKSHHVLIVSSSHPLAHKAGLTLEDFKDDLFLTPSDGDQLLMDNYLDKLCEAHGFIPHKLRGTYNISSLFSLVELGRGVGVVNALANHPENPAFFSVDIDDSSDIVATWKLNNLSSLLSDLVHILSTTFDSCSRSGKLSVTP